MLVAHDPWLQYPREGGQGIYGGIEPLGGQGPLQGYHRVQMAESGDYARVGVVVGGDVYRLEGGYGALLGGRDALLEGTHLSAEGGLVPHRRGHSAEEGRYLHARQDIPVDIIDEQEPSWFFSSRKYSAIVRPVRPILARTPGGSFICPKTRTVLSITPDARISCQRSFPLPGALSHPGENGNALVHLGDVA